MGISFGRLFAASAWLNELGLKKLGLRKWHLGDWAVQPHVEDDSGGDLGKYSSTTE